MQSTQGVNVARNLEVVDRGTSYQVRGLVARATVGVDDYGALAGKILQQSGTNGLHYVADGRGIVIGRHADEDVRLADVNQLAQKLIGKNAFLGQLLPRWRLPRSDVR